MKCISTFILSIFFLSLLCIPGYSQTISGPGFAGAMRVEPEMAKKIGYLRKIGINGVQPVEGINGLIATMKDTSEPAVVRVEAARAIGRVGDAGAIASLQEASIIPSETIRLILSGFFDKKGITPNPDEIINADGELGAAAIVALERLYSAGNEAGQRDALLNLINYSNAPVKREAALALAESGDERTLLHLKDLGLLEAHEKLKLLLEMKDNADVDRTRKLMGIVKARPSSSEEAARRWAAVSILAERREDALSATTEEIDLFGKKENISADDLALFISLSTVVMGMESNKAIAVFEKFQNHSDRQIKEISNAAIISLRNNIPAVNAGPSFNGSALLK